MKSTNLTIGEYLRGLRHAAALTLRAVEDKTGVSNPLLSQIESGKVRQPSPSTLFRLANLYGVPYDDLMERAGYPPSDRGRTRASTDERALTRFGRLTAEEEGALLDYLAFVRSRAAANGRRT
jgi:transcriptional regulator with XRE-family HTH domain